MCDYVTFTLDDRLSSEFKYSIQQLRLFLAIIMNVAALLQDSPSEDTNNRRRPPDNTPQRTWPPPSSPPPPLQQPPPPSSTPTSTWGPTSSSGIHRDDRPPTTHWQERDRALSNPNLVGPGTGVPPSPYIHSGILKNGYFYILFIYLLRL